MGERVVNTLFCAGGGGWTLENGGVEETWDNAMNNEYGSCWWACNDFYNGLNLGIHQDVNLTGVTEIVFDWEFTLERNSGDDTWVKVYLDDTVIREGSVLNEDVWDPFTYAVDLTGVHTIALRMQGGANSYVGVYGWEVSAVGPDLPPAPVAAFTGNPLFGWEPLQVQFLDASTNTPTAWLWSFGDGVFSALQDPLHTYTLFGVYTILLKATNAGGDDTEIKVGYITVLHPLKPTPEFSPIWTLQIGPL